MNRTRTISKTISSPHWDMSHSYTSKAVAQQNGLAVGHRYWFGHPFPAPNLPIPPGSLPAGQLISSAEDMAHYLIAHLNGGRYGDVQILSGAGIDELHRGAAEINEMGISLGQLRHGMVRQDIGRTKTRLAQRQRPRLWLPSWRSCQSKRKAWSCSSMPTIMWMTPILEEVGMGVAQPCSPASSLLHIRLGFIPWVMRGLLLIPLLQIAGVVATLRLLRRWRQDPELRPSGGRMWGLHILLPLIPNLLVALTLIPMLGKMRGYLMLYMPDYSWIAMVCGSFAGIWTFLRTGLVLLSLRNPRPQHTPARRNSNL